MSGNWCPDRDLHWNCQGHCQIHQIDRNCLPNFEWCLHHLLAKLKKSKHAEGNQSYRKVSMWASHLCLLGNTDKVPNNSQNMSCTCMRPAFILLLVTAQRWLCSVQYIKSLSNKTNVHYEILLSLCFLSLLSSYSKAIWRWRLTSYRMAFD